MWVYRLRNFSNFPLLFYQCQCLFVYIIKKKHYTTAWRYEFYFLVAKTIFYSLAGLVRKILFCHWKIKFISSHHRVISLPGGTPLYKPYRCVLNNSFVYSYRHFKARYLSQWKAAFHWWLNCISSQFFETDLAVIWVKRVKREVFWAR